MRIPVYILMIEDSCGSPEVVFVGLLVNENAVKYEMATPNIPRSQYKFIKAKSCDGGQRYDWP